MKKYTTEELQAIAATDRKLWRELAREHGMTTKLDSDDDILNTILLDGVFFEVDPQLSWYKDLPEQGAFTVTYYHEVNKLTERKTQTFRTTRAAERFCVRFEKLIAGEIIHCNY